MATDAPTPADSRNRGLHDTCPEIFDAECGIGGLTPGVSGTVGVETLLADMTQAAVRRALVRIEPTRLAFDIPAVNRMLYAMCEPHAALAPVPVAAPNAAGDLGSERRQIDEAVGHGAGAVVLRPHSDFWSPTPWGCRALMEALDERRMPVFCHVAEVSLEAVATLAGQFPRVPFILAGVGYREHRIAVPLLQSFANVHLVVGSSYIVFHGIESCIAAARPEQLLLGTGYAQLDLLPAISYVMYAEISESQRALVAGRNLERLIEGIQR